AEVGVRLGATLSPEFTQTGIDADIGLLVANRKEKLTKIKRARICRGHFLERPGRIMQVGDVGHHGERTRGEIVVEGGGPRRVEALAHSGGGEKLSIEVRFVRDRKS